MGSGPIFRFGAYELRPHDRELYKNGIKLKIRPQPLQVLHLLVSHPGDVVTRDQLRQQLWSADTFVDFEHSLNTAIKELRGLLSDAAAEPRYIETLPRLGYRFIPAVDAVQIPPSSVASLSKQSAQSEPSLPLPLQPIAPGVIPEAVAKQPIPRRSKLALATGLAVVVACAVWLVHTGTRPTNAAPRLNSIAVLPLDNLSGDPSQDYFAEGMTDQLITDLAEVGSLRVISRTSVMQYKGTKKRLPQIARELNVDAVVEGSIMRSGQRVRVTAQLVQASTDEHLWAETYDRDLGDVLRLQGEVAQTIAERIRARLTPRQEAIFRSARPVNPQAYEAYLRGRYYMDNQYTMPGPVKMAKNYFEESIHKDPGFALGYSGLALDYIVLQYYGNGELSTDQAYPLAKEAVQKSLQLDDSNGEAHLAAALLSLQFEWDFKTAEREFDQSIALAPSYASAHESRALFLASFGRRDETLEELGKIGQLDPGPGSMGVISDAYYKLRDYRKLIEVSRQAVTLYPNEWTNYVGLGIGYEATGRRAEAITEYQKAVELSEGNLDATAFLAHAYAEAGRRDEAEKILASLQEKSKTAHVSPYFFATIYAGLHQNERAFSLLERAYQEKSPELLGHLSADVRLDNLRSDPRFQAMLRHIGLST